VIFGRHHKPSLGARARNLIWPRSGWLRATRYLAHRVGRLPGTPYAIAAGFACGAAASMTPLMGFHFVLAGLLAWIIGGSILASAIGTAVGNPWTFPFIWVWIYNLGSWILGLTDELGNQTITPGYVWEHPMDVLLPMLAGSLPTGILTWLIIFLPIRHLVRDYQSRRSDRLARRALARQGSGGIE